MTDGGFRTAVVTCLTELVLLLAVLQNGCWAGGSGYLDDDLLCDQGQASPLPAWGWVSFTEQMLYFNTSKFGHIMKW